MPPTKHGHDHDDYDGDYEETLEDTAGDDNQPDPSNSSGSSPPDCPRVLEQRHRAELHASGLTDATIEAMGCYSCDDAEGRRLLEWPEDSFKDVRAAGLVFPYPGTNGLYAKIKLNTPRRKLTAAEQEEYKSLHRRANSRFSDHGADPEAAAEEAEGLGKEISMKLRFTGSHAATCL